MNTSARPSQSTAAYAFICYSHQDVVVVQAHMQFLNQREVATWFDGNINVGTEWNDALAQAIQGCERFVYFVSPSSVASEHCRRELTFAQDQNKEIIAIWLQETAIPAGLQLQLNNRQALTNSDLTSSSYQQKLLRVLSEAPLSESTKTPSSSIEPLKPKRAKLYVTAIFVLLVAGTAWWLSSPQSPFVNQRTQTGIGSIATIFPTPPNSIAVLPLQALSTNKEHELFAQGLHSEVVSRLAKIPELSVIARISVLQYADSEKPPDQVAEELGVQYLVEGNARFASDQLRLTVHLLDAKTRVTLWTETFERPMVDLFKIESDVALRIANALQIEMSEDLKANVTQTGTRSPEAHSHYLRAMALFKNYQPTDPVHAELEKALQIDPEYADALAQQAKLYGIESFIRSDFRRRLDSSEVLERAIVAEELAQKALRIDPNQGLAYAALANVAMVGQSWQRTVTLAEHAFALRPNDYQILTLLGNRLLLAGRKAEGRQLIQRSVALAPNNIANAVHNAQVFLSTGLYEDAMKLTPLTTEAFPDAALPYAIHAVAQANLGNPEAVKENMAQCEAREPGAGQLADLAWAAQVLGDEEVVGVYLSRIYTQYPAIIENQEFHARLLWLAGEYDQAYDVFANLLEDPLNGTGDLFSAVTELTWLPGLYSHPRFPELAKIARTPVDLKALQLELSQDPTLQAPDPL